MEEVDEAQGAVGDPPEHVDGLRAAADDERIWARAERLAGEFRRACRYGEPLSLILLDVDQFKAYNDSFGHLAGNDLLRVLARVLRPARPTCWPASAGRS